MRRKPEDISNLRQWLQEEEYTAIVKLAGKKKRILSSLTALTYDPNQAISNRAIIASGLAAKTIAEDNPDYVRNYLLRLFWLVNDESGGIGWRAPELIGEILHHCPQFKQFFPMLISLLDLEAEDARRFRVGTLWAIGRVAQVAGEEILPALPRVRASMLDENPDTKNMARWCENQLLKK
jgi:hypothetical protein